MKRQLTIAATAFLSVAALQAQSVADAARFGTTSISGTARYRSMAGAFGALGGDPSCMNDNPAGLAIYRKTSLFSFTPNFKTTSGTAFGSEQTTEKRTNVSMSNMSAIFSFPSSNSDRLVNFTMGIGFERKFDNHSRYNVVLDYCDGCFGDYLKNQANDYLDGKIVAHHAFDWNSETQAPILSMMGYDCYAFEEMPGNEKIVRNPIFDEPYSTHRLTGPNDEADVFQLLYVDEHTRLDQYTISGALNFNDMLYVGASIKISDFSSVISTEFDEQYAYDYDKSYILYDNNFETKGSGVGINLGLLWMPIDNWRIGAAIHTPTWSDFEENYEGWMTTDDDRFIDNDWSGYNAGWRYCFDTPWEYQFSTAYVIGTRGLVSLEYDLRDFSSLRYRKNSDFTVSRSYFTDFNTAIKDYQKLQHTLKIGGEYRITKQWSARAGYAFVTSPWEESARRGWLNVANPDGTLRHDEVKWNNYTNKEYTNIQNILYYSTTKPNYQTQGNQYYWTCGAGWRGKQWTLDAAYMYHYTRYNVAAYPDDFGYCEPVGVSMKEHSFDLTVGYRF